MAGQITWITQRTGSFGSLVYDITIKNNGSSVEEYKVYLKNASGTILDREPDSYWKNISPGQTATLTVSTVYPIETFTYKFELVRCICTSWSGCLVYCDAEPVDDTATRTINIALPSCTNFVLSLNKPASTVEIGQSMTFSGQLSCNGIGASGKTIEIWDTLGINEKIATATTTTTNGMFSAPWTVKNINYYPNSGKISVYAYYPETGLKSQEYVVTLSSIPPSDIRYSCNLGVCQETVNGQYATFIECQNVCKVTQPTPDKYKCVNGTCLEDNVSGTLAFEQCQSTCKPTPPSPTTKYNCINNTCTPDVNGVYSVEECQDVCRPPSGCPSGYYKAANGRCKSYIRTPIGNIKEEDAVLLLAGTIGTVSGIILLKEMTKK